MPPSIERAVRALQTGGVIVYPTDTLWGLGVRASDAEAVRRLSHVKERPDGMPISVALSSHEEVDVYAELDPHDRRLVRRELPGPVTVIAMASARARRELAAPIFGAGRSIGVRIPDHPIAREIARRVGPVTCTSANRHGRPPVRSVREARREFGTEVEVYLEGTPKPSGVPSRIVDVTRHEHRWVHRS